ncbi:DUF4956 domain-containing protein [Salininema proteolyticum]|uniref:DUF4956 domain-containing protein n=1 Tax=Salininema proteolyticum TaxID=1607685 RepID=A0ABV8TT00_9ACTN
MTAWFWYALFIDIAAVTTMAVVIYYRRHRRSDLMFAYIALNIGVFSVASLMLTQQVELAVAFGLFGVLSIIRLRSDAISQREIGYYFTALALGLITSIGSGHPLAMTGFAALLPLVLYIADHPRFSGSVERCSITLDRVVQDPAELEAELSRRLRGRVVQTKTDRVDYVRDTMLVEVKYRPWPADRPVAPVYADR